MTRSTRKLAFIALAIAVLVLTGMAVLPLFIDVNEYRGLIQSKAEEALGRKVTLGVMSLSVFPSVAINLGDPEVEGLLRARTLTVGVRLLPLIFGGNITLKTVALHQAEITLTRRADGRWDLPGTGAADGGPSVAAAQGSDETQPGAAAAFALSNLKITDATIHLIDHSAREKGRQGAPLPVDFKLDLSGSVERNGSGDLRSEFEAHLAGVGLLLDVRGSVSRETHGGQRTKFDLTVDQAEIEIAKARELAASLGQPWPLPEGILKSRNLKLGGRGQGEFGGLLPAEFVISDLVLHDADLTLARDRRGRWNFDSLTQTTPERTETGAPGGKSIVVMKNLRLTEANVSLHDEATGGSPVDLTLRDLSLLIEQYAPGRPLVLELESAIEPGGGRLTLGGTIPLELSGKEPVPLKLEVNLSDLDARAVAPYLESLLDLQSASGRLGLKAKLTGTWPADIAASGSIKLEDVRGSPSESPITAGADFELKAREGARWVDISRFDASIGRSQMGLRGTIDNRGSSTRVDIEIPPSSIDGRDLGTFLALAGGGPALDISAGQPVKIQAHIKGDTKTRQDLEVTGSLDVTDLSLRHPSMTKPLEQVRGKLTLVKNGLDVTGFSGVIGGSDVAGALSLADFAAPRVSFTLTSRHADFWELMSFVKEDAPGAATANVAPSTVASADDFTRKINASGTLAIADGSFGTLAFTNLMTTLTMREKILRLDPVAMNLYDGTMTGAATLDMSRIPPVYAVTAETAGIDTDALLTANLQMKDTLSGALTGRLAVTASGAGRDEALANARGDATIRIENGHLGGINVLKVLSRASGLLGERSLKEVSGRLAKEGTDFTLLNANLKISGGRVISEGLSMTSPDFELKDDGELNMMAGTIRVAGQIIFSEALSEAMAQEKSRAVDYFWDGKRGRVNLPITLSGPVDAPTPNIDWNSASGQLAGRKVREAVGEKLKKAGLSGLLGDDGDKPRPVVAPAAPVQSGELSVAIEESGFSGNLLAPDLRIKGTLRGTGITEASVRITDTKGKLLHEESLARKIEKFYTTHDREAPAAINFRVEVEGARMTGLRGTVHVVVTVRDASGRAVDEPFEVNR